VSYSETKKKDHLKQLHLDHLKKNLTKMNMEMNYLKLSINGKKKLELLNNKAIVVHAMLSLLYQCLKIDLELSMISMKNYQFNMLLIVLSIIKVVMEDILS